MFGSLYRRRGEVLHEVEVTVDDVCDGFDFTFRPLGVVVDVEMEQYGTILPVVNAQWKVVTSSLSCTRRTGHIGGNAR
jgi:hypothetical protein